MIRSHPFAIRALMLALAMTEIMPVTASAQTEMPLSHVEQAPQPLKAVIYFGDSRQTILSCGDGHESACYDWDTNQIFIDNTIAPQSQEFVLWKEVGASLLYGKDISPFPDTALGLEMASFEFALWKTKDEAKSQDEGYEASIRSWLLSALGMDDVRYGKYLEDTEAARMSLFESLG